MPCGAGNRPNGDSDSEAQQWSVDVGEPQRPVERLSLRRGAQVDERDVAGPEPIEESHHHRPAVAAPAELRIGGDPLHVAIASIGVEHGREPLRDRTSGAGDEPPTAVRMVDDEGGLRCSFEEEGQMVAEGDEIVILESMKMEIPVVTETPGVVRELHVEPEQVVQEGDLIAIIDES